MSESVPNLVPEEFVHGRVQQLKLFVTIEKATQDFRLTQTACAAILQRALQTTSEGRRREGLAKLPFEHLAVDLRCRQFRRPDSDTSLLDGELQFTSSMFVFDELYPFPLALSRERANLLRFSNLEFLLDCFDYRKVSTRQFRTLEGCPQIGNLRLFETAMLLKRVQQIWRQRLVFIE